jgi:small-conductance mechanosensitive channel/CRP-like cAMP-binding protein
MLAVVATVVGFMLHRGEFQSAAHPEWSQLAAHCTFTLAWIAALALLLQLVEAIVWERVFPMRSGVRVPRLLRQFVGAILWVTGFTMVLSNVWGISASAVLATSGALGIVFGLALRNILADFFSGIALNIEQPFHLDDFIRVRQRGIRADTIGFVREINWRSTRILTPEDHVTILPNSAVVAATIDNLDLPSPVGELDLEVILDWNLDPAFTDPVLNAAMVETWAVRATYGDKPPKCRIRRLDGAGVAYKISYKIDPHTMAKGPARHELLTRVHKHLRFAGLHPMPSLDATNATPTPVQTPVDYDCPEDRARLISQLELFKVLTGDERSTLAQLVTVIRPSAKTEIVRVRETGNSMFVVAAGVLEVFVSPSGSDQTVRVAVLAPGDFFGEMSLLTGEARTATVVALCPCVLYEVTHGIIRDILSSRPKLVESLSRVVAERRLRSEAAIAGAEPAATALQRKSSLAASMSQHILKFFAKARSHLPQSAG